MSAVSLVKVLLRKVSTKLKSVAPKLFPLVQGFVLRINYTTRHSVRRVRPLLGRFSPSCDENRYLLYWTYKQGAYFCVHKSEITKILQ